MKELIISAKNGDPEAFGRLYESCRKAGLSIAKQFVKNDTDAEDMYQDAFLKAMENIDRFDENREFGPWLNTIIANTCKDFLGKKRPMNFTDMSDEETEFVDTIESTDVSSLPESVYVRKEMLQIVDGIVEMLPNEQKEATVLFYFKDFSVKQVAEYQNVSEDTVKSRLNYSRKKVEQATKDYEKKNGIKICIASVIPAILVLYFKNNAYAAQIEAALGALSVSSGAAVVAKAGTGALKAGTSAGKVAAAKGVAAAKTVAAGKIAAIAGAGIIATTGAGFAIHHLVEKTPNGYINDEGYYVFGTYEQDGDESNGPEPIEWEILDENENGTLLISRYVLDSVQYNETREEVTWENCSLRSWLNNDFYNTAFDDGMKASINTVTIDNEGNTLLGTLGGNDTSDKIFALSVSEILKYYNFNSYYTRSHPYIENGDIITALTGYSEQLIIPPTEYAISRGASHTTMTDNRYIESLPEYGYSDSCIGKTGSDWWLRTPSDYSQACVVGRFGRGGANSLATVEYTHTGVRPALYINSSIEIQEEPIAEEEKTVEEENTPKGYINDEGYYVFGTYEQDGDESNGPEPIEWEILDENENGTLLVSRYVLDCVQYHLAEGSLYCTDYEEYPDQAWWDQWDNLTWETCSLRSWMNNDFYNTAFDDEQKKNINTVTIINEDNQRFGTPGGNNTSDKIFALSVSEILKYYDFNTYYPETELGYSEQLIIPATEYAILRGVFRWSISNVHYTDETIYEALLKQGYSASCIGKIGSCWWLRTRGYAGADECIVDFNGKAGANCFTATGLHNQSDLVGVRPALYINR